MKVTHIIDSGGYYGAEVMLVHLCQAQQKAGLQVEVISIGTRGNYKKPLEEKLEAYGIPYLPWRMLALPDLRESFKILKHCRNGGTDVIHSHGYKGNILLGLIPKRWRKIPVITTVHGYTHHARFSKMIINQWLDRFCLPKLDAVVLVSRGMMHQVPTKKIGLNLYIIENGIPEIPSNSPSPQRNNFSEKITHIVSIGRLSSEKNFSFLIKKIANLINHKIFVNAVIYGDGPDRAMLEKLITDLHLKEIVSLPGYIEQPASAYAEADIYVNCSTSEGMPITLLESLRAGCLPLASDIEANKEILHKNGLDFLLFSLNDSSFEQKIIDYKNHQGKFKENLKNLFLRKYTSKIMEEKYKTLYIKFRKLENDK